MNSIIKQMLSEYDLNNITNIKYPLAEILQKVILVSLSKVGFFKEAVFCGGTSLRIFYGLNRFSEDLDFNLKKPDKSFKFNKYSDKLVQMLKSFGIDFSITTSKEEKTVEKVILVTNLYNLVKEYADSKYLNSIRQNQTLKIKLEVDTNPPYISEEDIEDKLLYSPIFSKISIFKIETLFAGKINAILTRPFSTAYVKGRDYYDYLFYMANHIKPNLNYLQYSLSQFKLWNNKNKLELNYLKNLLENNFKKFDVKQAKNDVRHLIKSSDELDIWSNDTFLLTLKDLK